MRTCNGIRCVRGVITSFQVAINRLVRLIRARVFQISFCRRPSLFCVRINCNMICLTIRFTRSQVGLFRRYTVEDATIRTRSFLFTTHIIDHVLSSASGFVFVLREQFFRYLCRSIPVFAAGDCFMGFTKGFFINDRVVLRDFNAFLQRLFIRFRQALQ